jgi:hypothetical protein
VFTILCVMCTCEQVEPLTIIDDPADWKAKVSSGWASIGPCLLIPHISS